MYVTMNRCCHLYTKIPYSKHCLQWIQISCHSMLSVSFTYRRISLLQFSNRRSFNCFHL